jgi:hypothetical protein
LNIFTNELIRNGNVSFLSLCIENYGKENYWTYIFDLHTITNDEEEDQKPLINLFNLLLTNQNVTKVIQHSIVGDMLFKYDIELDNFYEINVSG